MNEHLSQLEALSIHPSLKVNLDQHVTIVESIVHHLMHPYFLQKSPDTQEKFKDQYLAHLREIVGYCLREYVEGPVTPDHRLHQGLASSAFPRPCPRIGKNARWQRNLHGAGGV